MHLFSQLILATVIAACAAAPQFLPNPYRAAPGYYPDTRTRASIDRNAQILRSTSDVNENGFHYAFDTDNGISAEETGVESNGIQASGQYSYTGDDGQVYNVRYTADANGFQAQGAHLPTPPPIPEAIARALQQNAADEARGIFDDGSYNDGKYSPGSVFAARSNFQYRPPVQPQYQPNQYQPNPYQPVVTTPRYRSFF
ncbi:insect cuticle protein domain-containing protein [Phthorimaea operculella]|nr:insect cuticle protein domain-containing protein [Phthorimaea operculella]